MPLIDHSLIEAIVEADYQPLNTYEVEAPRLREVGDSPRLLLFGPAAFLAQPWFHRDGRRLAHEFLGLGNWASD